MKQSTLGREEILRRKKLSESTRKMICGTLEIQEQDENSIKTTCKDFDLRIIFSELHPLMLFCLEKPLEEVDGSISSKTNFANLTSVLGSHCVNEYLGCYQYRSTHWIDTEMTQTRFLEILERCVLEASRGYEKVAC